jgi:hypothetical protein
MGYEAMGGMAAGQPPQGWEAGYVDARLAPQEQMAPADQWAGVTDKAPHEVAADQRAADEQAAAASAPPAVTAPAALTAPSAAHEAIAVPAARPAKAPQALDQFPQLYGGGSDYIVASMRKGGASDGEITTELLRLRERQAALMTGLPLAD